MRPATLLLALLLFAASLPGAAEAADCRFALGFAALHDQIPAIVGDCLEILPELIRVVKT